MQSLITWSGRLALIVGLLTLLFMLLQGPGYKAGWFDVAQVFRKHFAWIAMAGGAAVLLGVIALLGVKFGGAKTAIFGLVGLLSGGFAASVPIGMKRTAEALPLIHDITTDTVNPPAFVEIAPRRANAPNPASYDPEIASQQRDGYPDIKTLAFANSTADVFAAALTQLREMGLEIVAESQPEGRIEATATTAWFGFKDDVVVRLANAGESTRVDVRSKSRVGLSDLGVNAERIREFRDGLTDRLTN